MLVLYFHWLLICVLRLCQLNSPVLITLLYLEIPRRLVFLDCSQLFWAKWCKSQRPSLPRVQPIYPGHSLSNQATLHRPQFFEEQLFPDPDSVFSGELLWYVHLPSEARWILGSIPPSHRRSSTTWIVLPQFALTLRLGFSRIYPLVWFRSNF